MLKGKLLFFFVLWVCFTSTTSEHIITKQWLGISTNICMKPLEISLGWHYYYPNISWFPMIVVNVESWDHHNVLYPSPSQLHCLKAYPGIHVYICKHAVVIVVIPKLTTSPKSHVWLLIICATEKLVSGVFGLLSVPNYPAGFINSNLYYYIPHVWWFISKTTNQRFCLTRFWDKNKHAIDWLIIIFPTWNGNQLSNVHNPFESLEIYSDWLMMIPRVCHNNLS